MDIESGIKRWGGKFRQYPNWLIILYCILLSEILTAVSNTVLSLIWWDEVSLDLLYIGAIDAFFVSFIVGAIIIYFFREIKAINILNEKLQAEIKNREEAEIEREKIEIKAMEQAKLAYLGELSTGIAHEINQPLSYIKTMIEGIMDDYNGKCLDLDELNRDCSYSLQQINRIAKITNQLRSFGRYDDAIFETINFEAILENTLILMGQRFKLCTIQFYKDIKENLPPVWGNSNKLEQVFINVFQNALDALEGINNGSISASIYADDENNVKIRITDNGRGVPGEIANRIFEPFFTTKEVGKGTGLGLSIVDGIIQDHKGEIECIRENPGTTILITLPGEE